MLLHVCPEQTIADMIVYNKSRREARNRLVARSWERPYLKFKVGPVPRLTCETHVLMKQHCCHRPAELQHGTIEEQQSSGEKNYIVS